jgi:quercetin 2,3-dioxygenase
MGDPQQSRSESPVLEVSPLGFPWRTPDPFLVCVYHEDAYPEGNERLGPAASLAGRDIGQDFQGKDGWRMYHGQSVPGFPEHPHRGFETVTIVRRGYIDHSDSAGATARYGQGDVQWLTAGKGIRHSEMFPLISRESPNPLELFQIWLNLPSADKLSEPHFSMLWKETIPTVVASDPAGRATRVILVAGRFGDKTAPPPAPKSWAARPDSDVAIWTLDMSPGATFTLPAAKAGTNRMLYLFRGAGILIGSTKIPASRAIDLRADVEATLENGPERSELLLLQGRPIGEPAIQYGPFVMTTPQEMTDAFADYRRTGFGGWPWPSDDPVHPRQEGRFARRPNGTVERPT